MSEKTKRGLEVSITAVFALALLLVGAVLVFSGGTATAKQFATLRLLADRPAGGGAERRSGEGWIHDAGGGPDTHRDRAMPGVD